MQLRSLFIRSLIIYNEDSFIMNSLFIEKSVKTDEEKNYNMADFWTALPCSRVTLISAGLSFQQKMC